jgi:hypothetical protein
MKKSTIMITAAVLIILGALTAFNIKIKQIYLTGSYKNRFNGMDFTPLKGLENLDISNSNNLGIQIEQGDQEGIWINGDRKKTYVTDFKGHTLKFGLSKEAEETGHHAWGGVIIITKKLNKITTSAHLAEKENPTDRVGNIDLRGFQLPKLDLQIALGVTVSLYKMQLDTLNAIVGDKKYGHAGLYIAADTKINTANLTVPGKSVLTLADPKITKAVYNLSDSATVSLNGKMVQMIK